jgi:dihydrofolate reductase
MAIVFLEMTQSLDGFTSGPDVSPEHPLGRGGERLHDWLSSVADADLQASAQMFDNTGAFILGRRTFDVGIDLWGEDGAFGRPCFVLTHRPCASRIVGPTTFTFVSDGIDSALMQARAAAGGKDICVMGGADVGAQYMRAGVVDELRLHLVPLLLGNGARLLDALSATRLEEAGAVQTAHATHLRYRVHRK